jgi:hypothetical protein
MNKKPTEPDEMKMPATEFDEMMRRALGAPPPPDAKKEPVPAAKKTSDKPPTQ